MPLQFKNIAVGNLQDDVSGNNYAANKAVYILNLNNTLAQIFSDEAGTIPIVQDGVNNVTGAKGVFGFWVEAGDYFVQVGANKYRVSITGADYFNNRVDETVNLIVDSVAGRGAYYPVGSFESGFTYTDINQVGTFGGTDYYIYTGGLTNLPHAVTAGTNPTLSSDYAQVFYSDHNNLTNRDAAGAHDDIYTRSFSSVDEMISFTGHALGLKYSTGATTWRVANGTKGIDLNGGLKAISLNGLWIDDFGCVADGTLSGSDATGIRTTTGTDNSANYKKAVDAFIAGAGKTLLAGEGQYNFGDNAILSYAGSSTSIRGYRLVGQGGRNKATYFMLVTGGVEKWFYQNGTSNQRYQFQRYEGICFGSDNINFGNFYNSHGTGHEQGANFQDCRLEFFDRVNLAEGTVGNSEYKWFSCKFSNIGGSVLELNNPQSVNHEYYSTEAETILGDVVKISTNGGGSVKWYGGSIILSTHGTIPDKAGVVVRNQASASGLGTGNQDFLFSGIKTELKTNQKQLYTANNTGVNSIVVKFSDSNLTTTIGGARNAVNVNASQVVRFSNCELSQDFNYTVTGANSATAQNGLIEFENCKDYSDISSRCSIINNYGAVRGRELIFADSTGSGDSPNYATDFDINFTNNGRGAYSSVNKTASLLQTRLGWPYAGSNEQSLILPDGAVVTKITVFRPPSGGSSAAYALKVGSNDKVVVYGQSTTDEQKNDHSFVVDNLNLVVGTDPNKKRIRIWADNGNALVQDVGFAIVEYY